MVTAPIGRLIRKIQRQDAYWARLPPSAGPITAEMPHTLDSQPCTRPRSDRSYRSPASVFTVACTPPAPIPCSPRNKIRLTMVVEDAQRADPARKMMVPVMRTGLRPHWSASLPCTGMVTVWVSR